MTSCFVATMQPWKASPQPITCDFEVAVPFTQTPPATTITATLPVAPSHCRCLSLSAWLNQPGAVAHCQLLNGPGGSILRVLEDGSLPPLPGRWVPQGGAPELTLPPLSQAFFVLLDAGASACMK